MVPTIFDWTNHANTFQEPTKSAKGPHHHIATSSSQQAAAGETGEQTPRKKILTPNSKQEAKAQAATSILI
jgi:hypothetical protein